MLTYEDRLSQAIDLLCGVKPPEKLVREWVTTLDEGLQDWVGLNCKMWWCQNIGIIDAAEAMANAPIEGAADKINYDK